MNAPAHHINALVGDFMQLYEEWECRPAAFRWDELAQLARSGARAYNEGNGPSFHILAFEGYPHDSFHERFLGYLLEAGFDPFKLVPTAHGAGYTAVFGHEGLAAAALDNPASARMQDALHAIARRRWGAPGAAAALSAEEQRRLVRHCQASIPSDVLAVIGS